MRRLIHVKPLLSISLQALVAVALLSSCSTLRSPTPDALLADDYTLVKEYMQKFMPQEMKKRGITGLSVALVDTDKIVWSQGFGYSDKATKTPATAETQYRAGSVSKLFTAIAVMQQVEAGKIDLDSPLRQYVPSFNINSRFGSIDQITLRNTLAHHSGLPDSYVHGMFNEKPESFKNIATHLTDYYTAYPPNTIFSYSNSGYSLAGHAVENVSGQPFAEYQQEHLLKPLGMKNSNFEMNTSDPLVSKSYRNGKLTEELPLRDLPAGGLITNVTDLSQLVINMHTASKDNSLLLQSSTLNTMMEVQQYDSQYELTRFNGIGFMQHPNIMKGQFNAVGHGGDTLAHSALLISIPEIKLGAVLLANSPNSGSLQHIMAELLQIAYPVKTQQAFDSTIESPYEVELPGTETTFEGNYASVLGMVKIEGGPSAYKVDAQGQNLSLKPNKLGEHKVKLKLLGLIPLAPAELKQITLHAREIDNAKLIVADNRMTRIVVATELQTQAIQPSWHARIGSYKITNPIDSDNELLKITGVTLGYDNDSYYIKGVGDKSNTPITVITDSEATVQGWSRGQGETILALPDNTLAYSGLLFHKE